MEKEHKEQEDEGSLTAAAPLQVVEPQELSSLSSMDIVNVVAGGYHSFALSSEGFVFAWGKNTNGQLGLGIITPAEISPRKVPQTPRTAGP
eukprot:746404-Hanusia_phi.AAC.4